MKLFKLNVTTIVLFVFSYELFRRLRHSINSLEYLNEAADNLEINGFDTSPELKKALDTVQSPAILLLNKHALNVTLNFLCNLRIYNVSDRIVMFAFDYHSYTVISKSFPEVHSIFWKLPALEDRFTAGDGRYQLFQYFRAVLSTYLSTKTTDFWMVQADTIWRANLFTSVDVSNNDLTFDQEGEEGLLSKMIAGGYYHVKSSEKTRQFFENIRNTLLNYYVTDNNLMTRQCLLKSFDCECGNFPYKLMANWRYEPNGNQPPFLQYDGGDGAEEKFINMKKIGALFVDPSSLAAEPKMAKCLPNIVPTELKDIKSRNRNNLVIRGAHQMFEWAVGAVPGLRTVTLAVLFPFYAYFLAI